MTCEDLESDGSGSVFMNKWDKLTTNFTWVETWSSIRLIKITFKRAVEPCLGYYANLKKTAKNIQIVRDRLNEAFGDNPRIGLRNRQGEIYITVNSWWRTRIFQLYLYLSRKSTVKISKHQTGIAIDIAKIKGLTVRQLRLFIEDECDTAFTKIIEYSWGLHLDWR